MVDTYTDRWDLRIWSTIYVWSVYENNVKVLCPVDTISRTCELGYPVTLKPGSYTLLFRNREKKAYSDCSIEFDGWNGFDNRVVLKSGGLFHRMCLGEEN
ncbi:MAG: hypothetical protein ACLU4J_26740 [Butyricimonas paravirosa]